MNIQPVKIQSPNFKSTYPVVHWVAEANGSYAPVMGLDIVRKLQRNLISSLNKTLDKTSKPMDVTKQTLRAYISSCDASYRVNQQVRSFYDRISSGGNRFSPTSYIISGNDVEAFEEKFAKAIGRNKRENNSKELTREAVKTYTTKGFEYVNNAARRLKDKSGIGYVLHTKFEIIRNKLGKIKGYKFIDARFLPEKGPNSPFEKFKL